MDPHFSLHFFKSNDPNARKNTTFFNFLFAIKSFSGVFNGLNCCTYCSKSLLSLFLTGNISCKGVFTSLHNICMWYYSRYFLLLIPAMGVFPPTHCFSNPAHLTICMIVWLYHSTCPLALGWYDVVCFFATSSNSQTFANSSNISKLRELYLQLYIDL